MTDSGSKKPTSQSHDGSHRRFNALTGDWVLVSPQRNQRPWQGLEEPAATVERSVYEPHCYLCPGNDRAGGQHNPDYQDPFAFDNDFPALQGENQSLAESTVQATAGQALFRAEPETGRCRVLCFSPRHDLNMGSMGVGGASAVASLWQSEYRTLGSEPEINHVQIFENRGEQMGCSNPHPHGQVWATSSIPPLVLKEQQQQEAYLAENGQKLLLDYLGAECEQGSRTVLETEHFVALVPYWATWPFETLVLPRLPVRHLLDLDTEGLADLAGIYGKLVRCYDEVFACEFPYSAGIHQAPTDGQAHEAWQLHLHFLPPLLRSGSIRKHMVGFELLAQPQRDITPEQAAMVLREAAARAAAKK